MNLIRIALILLVGWLIARLIKHYLDKIQNGPTELVKCPKCQTYISKGSKHSCAPPNGNSAASCFLLFLVLGLLPGLAHADGGGRYLIEVSGQYIDVGLEVNDIPVLAWQIERQATAGASLNHWLRRGKNTMRLTIRAHGTGQASALAKIFFVGGAKNGQQQLVSMLEIKDYRQAQNGVPFSFNLASAPDLALWHGQKPSQAISPETARALVATFRQQMISALLAGGSLNDVALLADERADYAKAFGAPATSGAIALASQKTHAGGVVSRLVDLNEVQILPLGDTGLYHLARKDGQSLVHVQADDQSDSVKALIVGWYDGEWRIIRRCS